METRRDSCHGHLMALPKSGLYRTTVAHPLNDRITAGILVFVGTGKTGTFVVVPHYNEANRWFWRDDASMTPLADGDSWAPSLESLPAEGFYTLPRTLNFESGGRWLQNAIVQLGYDRQGTGILFIAERRATMEDNALYFSDRGQRIGDDLLRDLTWAPILPVTEHPEAPPRH